jgi:hypothetical protein
MSGPGRLHPTERIMIAKTPEHAGNARGPQILDHDEDHD